MSPYLEPAEMRFVICISLQIDNVAAENTIKAMYEVCITCCVMAYWRSLLLFDCLWTHDKGMGSREPKRNLVKYFTRFGSKWNQLRGHFLPESSHIDQILGRCLIDQVWFKFNQTSYVYRLFVIEKQVIEFNIFNSGFYLTSALYQFVKRFSISCCCFTKTCSAILMFYSYPSSSNLLCDWMVWYFVLWC